MYNPNTYDWYQCDAEDYNSNDSPAEQAESAAARKQFRRVLLAAMRAEVAEVPSYCERYSRAADDRCEAEMRRTEAEMAVSDIESWTRFNA